MKIGAIIQARMGSTRLHGKVMKTLEEKTVLAHVIDRVRQSKMIDEIIIATTTHDRDDVIELEALSCGVKVFRGSEDDVLSRYYYAAIVNGLDVIVRITSDCPLIDSIIIDKMIKKYLDNACDLLSNTGINDYERTFPRGLDISIFPFESLKEAFKNAKEKYQREHVTPYIYQLKNVQYFKNNINYSKYRWTLDTEEDFRLITEVYRRLYSGKHDFYMKDIIKLFNDNPNLININKYVDQKKLRN